MEQTWLEKWERIVWKLKDFQTYFTSVIFFAVIFKSSSLLKIV